MILEEESVSCQAPLSPNNKTKELKEKKEETHFNKQAPVLILSVSSIMTQSFRSNVTSVTDRPREQETRDGRKALRRPREIPALGRRQPCQDHKPPLLLYLALSLSSSRLSFHL